ncbi:MAG: trypsin-like peptidase domain-containing protein [Xenococcaceae cyanobacterium MO_188.B32]|nr:trypsin-like peptidase domain-containing protein [Xenococcaceae cyanobacterium MO_188.B32]
MEHRDTEELIKMLARQATFAPIGPQAFFINLVRQANLPQNFVMEVIGVWTGNPDFDARTLVQWAVNKGVNPQDPRFTVLGSILKPLLQNVGLDIASQIIALIIKYRLYRDADLLRELPVYYEISNSETLTKTFTEPVGPDFNWRGPSDEKELQAFWQKRQVTNLDVGNIQRGIQQVVSTCRIEIPNPNSQEDRAIGIGTGFLIKKNLLLTNYHVLAPNPDSDPNAYVKDIMLHFGYLTSPQGEQMQGQKFKLADNPILSWSPDDELDYALLKVEDSILMADNLQPVQVNNKRLPSKGMGINLLHHPAGQTMKIALTPNGITWIDEGEGLIQYLSDTSGGSSGCPCFSEDWQVVAIHHAQKSGSFGIYCEGILLSNIHEHIAIRFDS